MVDYSNFFNNAKDFGHEFYGYAQPGLFKICEVTPRTIVMINRAKGAARKKPRYKSRGNGAVPLALLEKCTGPQTFEQFQKTIFLSERNTKRAFEMLEASGTAQAPKTIPLPKKQAVQNTDVSYEAVEMPAPPTQFIPEEPAPIVENKEPEPKPINLEEMSVKDLRKYAMDEFSISKTAINKVNPKERLVKYIESLSQSE